MVNDLYFSGYFSPGRDGSPTYTCGNVRKHKPPMQSFFGNMPVAAKKTGWFVNAENGSITDEFYGSCNDFDLWFLGKVARRERFFFYLSPTNGEPDALIGTVGVFINGEHVKFAVDDGGNWMEI